MATSLRIAHISDLHLDNGAIYDIDRLIGKSLIHDLRKFHDERPIDIVAVTGDLIDKGGKTFDSAEDAYRAFEKHVLQPILHELEISRLQIFFTPGNHDIDFRRDTEIDELGMNRLLTSPQAVIEYMDRDHPQGMNRVGPFKDFERTFYGSEIEDCSITNFESVYRCKLADLNIGVACLNTAWRCAESRDDKGSLLLGERQLTRAADFLADLDLRIALLHHPMEYLCEFDRRAVEPLLTRYFDVVLCGHTHFAEAWSKASVYGTIFVSVASANWSYNLRSGESTFYNSYSLIDIDLDDYLLNQMFRRYSHAKQAYVPDNEKGNDQGIVTYQLPSILYLKFCHGFWQFVFFPHYADFG